jgi:hypothetical protein
MSRQVQRQPASSREQATGSEQEAPADLRNDELDADVACCLAEIDDALDEASESEEDRARREFSDILARNLGHEDLDQELRVWQAQYAHLGLYYGFSCCGAFIW